MTSPVPELVPARMVNEFTYCARLFFLEWVHARWAGNDDTADGQYVHRYVDKPGGAAPLPEEGDLRAARSVVCRRTDWDSLQRSTCSRANTAPYDPSSANAAQPPTIRSDPGNPKEFSCACKACCLGTLATPARRDASSSQSHGSACSSASTMSWLTGL
jgi:hypothetical protein